MFTGLFGGFFSGQLPGITLFQLVVNKSLIRSAWLCVPVKFSFQRTQLCFDHTTVVVILSTECLDVWITSNFIASCFEYK